jgi:hypothetical protein
MGRDDGDSDSDTDLLFWGSNEEMDSDLELAVDSRLPSICEFCASPNPGMLMLPICRPRVDCGFTGRWFLGGILAFAVCERAE